MIAQGKTDEARFQFQLVTEMEPENAAAWQQLLNMSLKAEDIPEVIRICTKCQELFPDAPEYYFYLGIAYYQQEKYQEALNTYYAGINIIPAENPRLKSDFLRSDRRYLLSDETDGPDIQSIRRGSEI